MARRKNRALRIVGWIVAGFLSLILVITLVFYLGRGWIMGRAVTYINDQQPGELKMDQMNLIPFMRFPDVSLQLKNVKFFESEYGDNDLPQEPIVALDEIFVILDVVDLIRGEIRVSEARFREGIFRMEIYEDSISNVERALGLRFGEDTNEDTTAAEPSLKVDLERIELADIDVTMYDKTMDNRISILVNELESSFSYFPDEVKAGVKLNIDLNYLKYLTYRSEAKRNLILNSRIIMDPVQKQVEVEPSSLKISGLELETWGSYGFKQEPYVDLAFRASNEGLEVLNYLFRGILNLDEIEQIGEGSIYLNGNITGSLEEQLPVIHMNGLANEIGFRITSIQKDITNISFEFYATNGSELDFSEGLIQVDNFSAEFPEGSIKGNISAKNMIAPEVEIELDGEVELAGLEEVVKSDMLTDLNGKITLAGDIQGVIDKRSGEFLNDAGSLKAALDNVSFVVVQDSGLTDSVNHLNGDIFLEENVIGTDGLTLEVNGNELALGARTENLLLYLLDFDRDLKAEISLSTDVLVPASLIRDSSVASMLGEEVRGLHFSAGAMIGKKELDAFLKDDSIPEILLSLDSFGVQLPVYADVSDMNASLTFGPDSIQLHHLNGTIGSSRFGFYGLVSNLSALADNDSGEVVSIDYAIASDLMLAGDFFTFGEEFLLPEIYSTEYLEDFRLSGSLDLSVDGLQHDSIPLDFGVEVAELGWNFRYYPLAFDQFLIQIRKRGDVLFIDDLQGKVGESNLKMTATLGNISDTAVENMYGSMVLKSDLLDFNELLNYQLPDELKDTLTNDTTEVREPPRLDQINYPAFDFTVDIGELRYGEYMIYGMNGKLRSTKEKIFYLDRLVTSAESGGNMEFNGQLNVSNPWLYTFSAEVNLKDVSVQDLDIEMQSGEDTYTLKENFEGRVTADGLAEVFITPDLKVDMSTTTGVFNLKITDGALINFTPLQAAAKYLDNKDLNNVRFATLQQFGFTLVDSRLIIPLMNVESTAGQLLIEGEQGLDNSYLYLLRVPPKLAVEAAKSVLSNTEDQEEDQIEKMKRGNFIQMTVWSNGVESDFKFGDRRDKYQ